MRAELFRFLAALPNLDPAHATASAIRCKMCGRPARFFDVLDFNKCVDDYTFGPSGVPVQWFRCDACEFLFTPFFDDWTADEFTQFVYNADYARVDPEYAGLRPARLVEALVPLLGPPSGLRILDYGSGAGVMVSGLREHGYDAHGYDPYSSPERPEGLFDLATCFEVIEHSPDPMGLLRDIRSLLKNDSGLILGECLQPSNIDEIRCNWWYCAPRNGHCSTFTARTLAVAAEQLGWSFHAGAGRHAFTSRDGGRVADLLARITGPRLAVAMLGAPAAAPAPGWHGIEWPDSNPFRWTGGASVAWRVPFSGAGMLEVQIPVRMAIHPEFLAGCRILIGGQVADIEMRKTALVARASGMTAADGSVVVELHMPEPRSPRDLSGAPDDRPLGLAVSVLESPTTQ